MRVVTSSMGVLASVANTLEEGAWRQPPPPGGRGGVTGLNGVAAVGVARRMGIGREGCEVARVALLFLVKGNVGKKSLSAGVMRQVACMAGASIVWIQSWLRNTTCPFLLAMRTNSTGHLAGERSEVVPSDCFCDGT